MGPEKGCCSGMNGAVVETSQDVVSSSPCPCPCPLHERQLSDRTDEMSMRLGAFKGDDCNRPSRGGGAKEVN